MPKKEVIEIIPGGVNPQYLHDEELRKARIAELKNERKRINAAAKRELMELGEIYKPTASRTIKAPVAPKVDKLEKRIKELEEQHAAASIAATVVPPQPQAIHVQAAQPQVQYAPVHQPQPAVMVGNEQTEVIPFTPNKQFVGLVDELKTMIRSHTKDKNDSGNSGNDKSAKDHEKMELASEKQFAKVENEIDKVHSEIREVRVMLSELVGQIRTFLMMGLGKSNAVPQYVPQMQPPQPVIMQMPMQPPQPQYIPQPIVMPQQQAAPQNISVPLTVEQHAPQAAIAQPAPQAVVQPAVSAVATPPPVQHVAIEVTPAVAEVEEVNPAIEAFAEIDSRLKKMLDSMQEKLVDLDDEFIEADADSRRSRR